MPSDLSEATRLIELFEQQSKSNVSTDEPSTSATAESPSTEEQDKEEDNAEEESIVLSPTESAVCFVYACTK